jgi:hypothetical protein
MRIFNAITTAIAVTAWMGGVAAWIYIIYHAIRRHRSETLKGIIAFFL